MTSRERVLTTFAHKEPDRVPMWCGAKKEFWDISKKILGLDDEGLRNRFHDDFRRVLSVYKNPSWPLEDLGKRTPFGILRHGYGYGMPESYPLAGAMKKDIENYSWPEAKYLDISGIREKVISYNREYAILGGEWALYWHDAIDLVGMENLFFMMYDTPELVDLIFTHIVDYYIEGSRKIFENSGDYIDIFFIGNDFGSQTGPQMGADLFTRFLIPHLKRFVDLGHVYGMKVMLHCCGGFEPLIPAMIEAGLDGVHAVQPDCCGMDLRQLKAKYGKKLLFNGGIDSRHVLIEGDVGYVIEKTKETLDIMKTGGGYVGGASHDTILEETPLENVLAMFDTIYEYGKY